jgi:hypothetical protein
VTFWGLGRFLLLAEEVGSRLREVGRGDGNWVGQQLVSHGY